MNYSLLIISKSFEKTEILQKMEVEEESNKENERDNIEERDLLCEVFKINYISYFSVICIKVLLDNTGNYSFDVINNLLKPPIVVL